MIVMLIITWIITTYYYYSIPLEKHILEKMEPFFPKDGLKKIRVEIRLPESVVLIKTIRPNQYNCYLGGKIEDLRTVHVSQFL